MNTPDPYDHLRGQLRMAAQRQATAKRPSWSWLRHPGRPLVVAVVGVAMAGTATAAVVTTSGTSDLDANATGDAGAAQRLAPVIASGTEARKALNGVQAGTIDRGDTSTAETPAPAAGTKGITITRGPLTIDVATSADQVCYSVKDTPEDASGTLCAAKPFQSDQLPIQTGNVDGQAWLMAVAPDGVTDIQATGDNGTSIPATTDDNIATVLIPGAKTVQTISWTKADGTKVTKSAAGGARVRPLKPLPAPR